MMFIIRPQLTALLCALGCLGLTACIDTAVDHGELGTGDADPNLALDGSSGDASGGLDAGWVGDVGQYWDAYPADHAGSYWDAYGPDAAPYWDAQTTTPPWPSDAYVGNDVGAYGDAVGASDTSIWTDGWPAGDAVLATDASPWTDAHVGDSWRSDAYPHDAYPGPDAWPYWDAAAGHDAWPYWDAAAGHDAGPTWDAAPQWDTDASAHDADSGWTGDAGPHPADVLEPDPSSEHGVVRLYVESATSTVPTGDSAPSQTPVSTRIAIQRLALLRTIDDATPVVVFDKAPSYIAVDLDSAAELGTVPVAALSGGEYAYAQIDIAYVEADVDVRLHTSPALPPTDGRVTILHAHASVTVDGVEMAPGDSEIRLSIAGAPVGLMFHWPVRLPAAGAQALVEASDIGTTRVTALLSPAPGGSAGHASPSSFVVRVLMGDALRWEDATDDAYGTGEWDVDLRESSFAEHVTWFGPTGYFAYPF